MALRGPHRRVSVSEQKANWSGGCGMSQSLAMRPARDSVTLARVREIVEQFAARDRSGEVLTAVHHIPAREAKFAPMPDWVRADLAAVYGEKGVGQLYSHQAAAAALAQDQLSELHDLSARLDHRFGVFTYDGDTPADARKAIRERGHIVLSNPDMLHTGILPHHTRWQRLFENLRFVVLDELHTYRGVFGSHLANVLRRLRRIARFYGSDPQFI